MMYKNKRTINQHHWQCHRMKISNTIVLEYQLRGLASFTHNKNYVPVFHKWHVFLRRVRKIEKSDY